MRLSSLYGHVAELYDLFSAARHPADLLVREFYRKRRYLGARDRRFISSVFFDSLRHALRLEEIVRGALRTILPDGPPIRALGAAVCAGYAIRIEGKGVEEVVQELGGLWRTVTTDVDPVRLFAAIAAAEPPEMRSVSTEEHLSWEHSIPLPLVRDILEQLGEEEGRELCRSLNAPAPVTVRVNTLRTSVEECEREFVRLGVPASRTGLSPDGLTLGKRMDLSGLQIFREGWFEMQDEGSQLLGHLLAPEPGMQVVDVCAGGGGKSLHAAALMRNGGSILALDIEPGRLLNLRERARRAGAGIIDARPVPEAGPFPSDWEGKGDLVLVDAPCSGTGTYRRNPGEKLRFARVDLRGLARIQGSILSRASSLVRSGGWLLYSTCSLLREENDGIVKRFLEDHPEFQLSSAATRLRARGIPVRRDEMMLHLYPHREGTDGFFAALMERRPV